VQLFAYLGADGEEQAVASAHAWIKELRRLPVDGVPFRRRFTYKNDSLWWFAELYLHKEQAILRLFRAIGAIEGLVRRERPVSVDLVSGDRIVRGTVPQILRSRRINYHGASGFGSEWLGVARLDLRARALRAAALASRFRPRRPASAPRPTVAAFVHRAFWPSGADESDAESYIGPVLHALEQRLGEEAVRYVAVGPAANFRARRWWHALGPGRQSAPFTPIEGFAPLAALKPSQDLWRRRHELCRVLWNSPALRRHATIAGCDCWPIVRQELAGIALLQWTWSARAMDEAGAALDALRPKLALTYAEAGGWGRALMAECRRRGIPSVGLQHGFIYRHWLNYLHEPDEMAADPEHPADAGFPRPSITLLFDAYASAHLQGAGRFPPDALAVSGSPRLDALVAAAGRLTAEAIANARAEAGAAPPRELVLVVTKYKEAREVLPALSAAVAAMPGVQLAIKTHPAETPDVYDGILRQAPNISVLPAARPLAPLLRASRAIVTVNSTVALDAAVLGVPALVIGLPNNLTPFVEAGVMAGAGADEIGPALERLLQDEGVRAEIARNRCAFLARYAIAPDGRAADRSVDAVLGMLERSAR